MRCFLIFCLCLIFTAPSLGEAWSQETGPAEEDGAGDGGLKKSRLFGIVGLTSTIGAVVSDALVEWNYSKYSRTEDSDECVRYRERTVVMERIRDGFLYSALASFATALVFSRLEQRSVSAQVHIRSRGHCDGTTFEASLSKRF